MWSSLFPLIVSVVVSVSPVQAFVELSPYFSSSYVSSFPNLGKTRPLQPITKHINQVTTISHLSSNRIKPLFLSEDAVDVDDDEDEQVEPGTMRVKEIKAELDARGMFYGDCFDKESLVARLLEARVTGKASPEILDRFNKQRLEDNLQGRKVEMDDELLKQAVASDGTLPGGMTPEMLQKLISNPEIMSLLQSTKMQDAMKLMMTGGPGELEEAMKNDPELREIVAKLGEVMKDVQ